MVHSYYKYSLNETYIVLGLFFCYKYNHFLVQFSSYYQLRITTSFKLIYRIDSNGYLFFLLYKLNYTNWKYTGWSMIGGTIGYWVILREKSKAKVENKILSYDVLFPRKSSLNIWQVYLNLANSGLNKSK